MSDASFTTANGAQLRAKISDATVLAARDELAATRRALAK